MPTYTVRQGDCLASIAHRFGFADWRRIYDAPENVAFRRLRPNPNVLRQGDELFVPEPETRWESVATGAAHRFTVTLPAVQFVVVLQDASGEPLKNRPYRLDVGAATKQGQTDADGMLKEFIPGDATTGVITAVAADGPGGTLTWPLDFGHLDPDDELSGVQARLQNLGLYHGPADGNAGDQLADAISRFQTLEGLEVTGELDGPTRSRLRQTHDAA